MTILVEKYRGFRIGYTSTMEGYRPAWKSSLEDRWTHGNIHTKTKGEIPQLVKRCIDFNCRKEAAEVLLGREMTLSELIKWEKQERA